MKNIKNKAFTLVELLVVITILAIISVVAYQSYGGVTSKATAARKVSDIASIEKGLMTYKVKNNYYPAVEEASATNLFGYDTTSTAASTPSNHIVVTQQVGSNEILALHADTTGGGRVFGLNAGTDWTTKQIGAKGTISQANLGTSYLSVDLYDTELGDINLLQNGDKMIDYGVGKYIYATYNKNKSTIAPWLDNKNGVAFNLAYTVKKEGSDDYETVIVGDYSNESCNNDKLKCPTNLIGLNTGDKEIAAPLGTEDDNQGVPYALTDFVAK